MMSLWDALRMNMMISYQELVRTFLRAVAGGTTHIIIAISTMYSLILRQNKTDKKSNESTLIQNLLT
ncbi:hypothetical protein FCX76_20930 [Escherichia coli]|nr:hypothetical protein [Escherichia coli]KNZ99629.1 hypothetical protein AKG99_08570 [Escherichia coli]MDN0649708.1 hypothetical protein [Escherichia coli]MDN0655508.1 hypothetical protein [Escherichia coli]MDN0659259.1 hypothetical protein [Escherichia coli]